MAPVFPVSGISLRGGARDASELQPGTSSGILLKLGDAVLQDLKRAARSTDGSHLIAGSNPKLRIGGKTIELNIATDAFRTELFASSISGLSTDFVFNGILSHRAELENPTIKSKEGINDQEFAEAYLRQSLESMSQEKQAKQATITNSVLPAPRNRFDAARREKADKKRSGVTPLHGSTPGTPSLHTNASIGLGLASTSMPASEDEVKLQAMKKPVVHLLAVQPYKSEEIAKKTNIPRVELDVVLRRVGKPVDGQWQLTDRAFRDLDPWNFKYPDQKARDKAIDNAVKAFDRLRLGRDEKLWQMLLREGERGQGVCLSRLHLSGGQVNSKSLTPLHSSTPRAQAESGNMTPSAARVNNSRSDAAKRMLSKDPRKARAADEAKDRKRKEREAAASDREGDRPKKRQVTSKKANANIKSAEFVFSSEDDDSGERAIAQPASSQSAVKPSKPKESQSSSDGSDNIALAARRPAVKKAAATTSNKLPSKPIPAGKSTPHVNNNLSAPKVQHSPEKALGNKPKVPSPLGAARPRVASDVSDRAAVGVQKVSKQQQDTKTTKGLGITNGVKKRHDTLTSTESVRPSELAKQSKPSATPAKSQKTRPDDAKPSVANGTASNAEKATLKRKPEEPGTLREEGTKHRKTESMSSQSRHSNHSADSSRASNGTARTSPDSVDGGGAAAAPDGSDSSPTGFANGLTYSQGVDLAEKFQNDYYPAYTRLYDEIAAIQARRGTIEQEKLDRLWTMHERLEAIKKDIEAASLREHEKE